MKVGFACRGRSDGEIADTHINPDDFIIALWRGIRLLDGEGNEQIESFLRCIVPEFGIANACSGANERNVLIVALVQDAYPAVQGADTDPALALKGVIPLIGVLNSW